MNIEIGQDLTMESAYDQNEIIIIDNGSDTLKIGYTGEDYPQVITKKYTINI